MSLWSCATCFKSFSRKGDLTRHKSLHTGIKPHVCETCGKAFSQFSGLKTHQNVHSKAKPYICGIGTCTKAFGDPSSRTRHRKETHRREGAYKCVITDCGTRIKRRSAFVAHLRKHGLDPSSLDLDAIVSQNGGSGISAPAHFAPPAVEDKIHHKADSRSVSPSFFGNSSEHYTSGASYCMINNGWSDGDPLDFRRPNWLPANDALLLGSIPNQGASFSPPAPYNDIYPYSSSDIKNPFYFDDIFTATADYPLLTISSLTLPTLEPFMEARSDGFQSSSSSPPSTHSILYTTDFNDDVTSLSPLAGNVSHESLLYNIM